MSSDNDDKIPKFTNKKSDEDDTTELRRGPWTLEEDNLLIKSINSHGEGRWNSLAKVAGLKRTGKSCRLRWLNYLNPEIKRGNFSPHEQILILELHSKWGNRWSKIAQHLPGRTDNEIKNYWRTRVQKQARQLKVDSNSKKFLDTVRLFWLPRLIQKMEQNNASEASSSLSSSSISTVETPQKKLIASSHDDSSTVVIDEVSRDVINSNDDNLDGNNNSHVKSEVREIPRSLNNPLTAKSMEDDDCYYVGFPSYDDVRELEYSFMVDTNVSQSGRHVDEYDWPVEDLYGSSTTFCNTDELWHGVI